MEPKILLKKVKNALSKKCKITRVYLFGSRARGVFHTDSDYDFAIISPKFKGMTLEERDNLIRPIIRKTLGYVPLDIVCYTKAEYDDGKIGFLPEIIEEEGISV